MIDFRTEACAALYLYIYIYIYICIIYAYIHTYIYREREMYVYLYVYLYVYIYIYRERERCTYLYNYNYTPAPQLAFIRAVVRFWQSLREGPRAIVRRGRRNKQTLGTPPSSVGHPCPSNSGIAPEPTAGSCCS